MLSLTKFKRLLFSSKKNRKIIVICLLLLAIILLIKSCSPENPHEIIYHIGQDNRWHGNPLMGKERNISAFNHNLLAAIAKQEHMRIKLLVMPGSDLMTELENGKLQGILTNQKSNPLNEKQFLFSEPFLLLGPVLIIPTNEPIEGWNEMAKKIVGVPSKSPPLLDLEKDSTIQLKFYDDILQALSDLSQRRIDGAIFPAMPAHIYTKAFYEHELKIATAPLNDDGLRLMTLHNETGEKLIKLFNEGLSTIKNNHAYCQLLDQWGLVNTENTQACELGNHHSSHTENSDG